MSKARFIVGITGGSGVGKTTLINILHQSFSQNITILSLDNYYKPIDQQQLDENGIINFDLPEALYTDRLEEDFTNLLNGKSIQQKTYNFNNPAVKKDFVLIEPKEIILVEGLFVMHYPFLREKLNYAVYLSVDKSLQLQRRLKRDVQERNIDEAEVIYQWENHVIPAYANYIKPHKNLVDLVITNNKTFDGNIEKLIEVIHQNID